LQCQKPYFIPLIMLLYCTCVSSIWNQLSLPFSPQDFEWRVTEVSEDAKQARLRPQLRYEVVVERLNTVLGLGGWSSRYIPLAEGVFSGELTIQGVAKSSLVADRKFVSVNLLAQDALVYAAEYFGLLSSVRQRPDYWVEYDPDSKAILFEPEPKRVTNEDQASVISEPAEKPAGQQAIDKLVERLRQEGQGLEAAKLLIGYGGYGQNPEAARELYAKLRDLLRGVAV
jgi:hypothetical protein